ncbi:MAG: hypothetical protein R3362_10720 [Rhodothermales bacterium]|nr:hypothetical protein [Rhodothermales bacterium]
MRRLLPALLLVPLLAAGSGPPTADATRPAVEADTFFVSVRAGRPLVTALPADGLTLRPIRLPALSWLVGTSFYWKTVPGESGREFVLVERQRDALPQDTLVLIVEVQPE